MITARTGQMKLAPEIVHVGGNVFRSLKCASCLEYHFDKTSLDRMLACGHYYCQDCLCTFAKTSIQSGTYPVCCSERLPLRSLGTALKGRHLALAKSMDKGFYRGGGYCAVATCSAALLPHQGGSRVGKCDECGAKSCLKCHNLDHGSKPCSHDADTVQILELAKQKRWMQCPRCRVMIEHNGGCGLMVCRVCSQKFCYMCGKSHSSCSCPMSLCTLM